MKKRIFAVMLMVVALFTCLLPFSAFAEAELIDLVPHSVFYIRDTPNKTHYSSGAAGFGARPKIQNGTSEESFFPSPFIVEMNTLNPIDVDIVSGSKLSFSFVFTIYSDQLLSDSSPENGYTFKYYFDPSPENIIVTLGSQNLVYGKDFFLEYPVDSEKYPRWFGSDAFGTTYEKVKFFRVYGEIDIVELTDDNDNLKIAFLYEGNESLYNLLPFIFSANYPELSIVPPPPPNPTQTLMQNLSTFSGGILGVWQVVVNFVTATGHEIALISVFAWLFVLGVGAIRRQITGV